MYNKLRDDIAAVIKPNWNGEITGQLMQQKLLEIVDNLDLGGLFLGFAGKVTKPDTEANGFYFSTEAGTYTNFYDKDGNPIVVGEMPEIIYRAKINDVWAWKHETFGGTYVKANPEGEPTETLEKLQIGDTVYTAPQGEQGEQGIQGEPGPANTLTIGTVQSGEEAAASITGESPEQVLNLTLPKGDKGNKGDAGHNPNLGTYLISNYSTNAPTTNILDGDYIVVVDNTVTPETSEIYKWNGTAWVTTGRDANDATFATNELVGNVSIINDLITGGEHDVLSAEQGVKLLNKLRYLDEEIGGFDNGYYNTNADTLPSIRNNLTGCKSAMVSVVPGQLYEIYGEALNNNYYRFYAFYDIDGNRIDRYASSGIYRDNPLLVTVPASVVTMVVNLGNYSATTDKLLRKGAYVNFDAVKNTLDEHTEDIAKLEDSENIVENFVSSISFSRFSTDGYGVYNFGQNFPIQNEGDFFEIRTRFYGEDTGYLNKLYIIGNDSFNGSWGFYSFNKICFRAIASDAWLVFDTPEGFDYKEFHIYKFQRTSVGFALYIDGSLIANKEYSGSGIFVLSRIGIDYIGAQQQKYDVLYLSVSIGGLLYTYTDFWKGGENIEPVFYTQSMGGSDSTGNLFYKYDATLKEMKVYTKMNTNFAEFTIKLCTSRGTANDPIYYRYFWEIQPDCRVCRLENGEIIPTTKKILVGGESECVIRATNYNSTDFTGGVHGDESIDVDADCFVEFFADGKVVPIEQSTDLVECSTFEYRQLSALHKTATNVSNKGTTVPVSSGAGVLGISENHTYMIDGVDTGIGAYNVNSVFSTIEEAINTDNLTAIDGGDGYWRLSYVREIDPLHTIIGYHSKVTSFEAGYKVRNGLRFTETGQNMTFLWYVGILCLAKEFASLGYNDALEKASFTGTNTHMLNADGTSRYYATNPGNGLSAVIDSRIVDGQGILSNELNNMHIWDRDIDSKYYNGTPIFTPNQKTLVGEMCLILSD